ncbi:MAG: carboxypeptidase-like regulatory domain-containing protein [Bacteroidales bacterium]|nr:carboxypeptidase-like regulatory domain-containing protein [Bacteroidales bacterium]
MYRFILHILLLILINAAFDLSVYGQETRISGKITDSTTGQPVPFVNIFFKNTTIGITSDLEGHYSLTTTQPGDSISASAVGYQAQTRVVKKGSSQVIDFQLNESMTYLSEVQVRPEERWIELLMRRVIKSKDLNNPDQIAYYQCEAYNKIQIDVNNLDEKFTNRKLFKPVDFIFENLDTSDLNQKVFLPALITESLSDVYFRKSPRSTREIIKANQLSGIENESFIQYLGGLFLNMNIYDNYLNVFDKNFVSPVANFGLMTYEYFLEDTVVIDGKSCYQIRFEPKRKQELTFNGTIWIHDTTFAVKQVEMRASADANFNWVNDFFVSQTYDKVNGQYWAITRDYRLVDMNPFEDGLITIPGFFGHKTITYNNYIFDQPKSEEFYSSTTEVIVENGADKRDDDWWEQNRPDTLKEQEQQIYDMVDSVMSVPAYQYYKKLGKLIGTGYIELGKFELGPVYKFLSFNDIEGTRFRLGGKTSHAFSKKLLLEGHVAYGTKDQAFKYGGGIKYMLNRNPRRTIELSYKYDMEQLGQDPNAFSEDNFFASFFRRSPADKLTMVHEYKAVYEHEWFTGFSNSVRFIRRDIYAIGDEQFIINDNGSQYIDNSLVSNEIQLYTRFAFRERYVYGQFERTSFGTIYPVIELLYGYGIPGFPDSDVEYHRLHFKVRQWFNVAHLGWSKYIFETGKIWGKLPYPFLKIHEGNETFLFYPEAGNMVNYYEFISDLYAQMYYTHHFDGLLLIKIPLMRKLKWREVVHGRAFWGSLSEENKAYSELPEGSGDVAKPYFEAGVGIENIFKVGRIDAIWRLSHLDNPDANRFGIFISFQFAF